MPRKTLLLAVVTLGLLALLMTACAPEGPAEAPAVVECPEAEPCPDCPACPQPVVAVVPFEALWAASPHADADSRAFRHWDEEDPAEIPANCAKCHSTPGFLDFLGEDGSEFGTVDAAAPIGSVVTCEACHNQTAAGLTSVVFPSGAEVADLGASARCMQCHQGNASGASVDAALADLGLTGDLDTPNEGLSFINIHYYAAAATLFGAEAGGGYQYAGLTYPIRFEHVSGYSECADCHNSHSLELEIASCTMCHEGASSVEDLRNIRMQGSLVDYDGDGDVTEGIYYEIETLQAALYDAITTYAADVAGAPIAYSSVAYPYFFNDTDGDGVAGESEANYGNRYTSWTGRLLQAAYNYQVSKKDPGAYVHNAKYVIALLNDSIVSLNEVLPAPVALGARNDAGHFDSTALAFRYWDAQGEVPSSCVKCHTADGLPFFLDAGVTLSTRPSNSFSCHTCHTFEDGIGLLAVDEVTFPSGAILSFADNPESNMCLECHQGRAHGAGIDALIARVGVGLDVVTDGIAARNTNPHYFAAGATLFGADAAGAYQYGTNYAGKFEHRASADACSECHGVHSLELNVASCQSCHGTTALETIRTRDPLDFDGDGDAEEGIGEEIAGMHEALYAAIQEYTDNTIAMGSYYPYWFVDANGNGVKDPDENEEFTAWTPRLLRAAYNYLWVSKDPGAYAHNGTYILQILYDTLQDIGGPGAVAGMNRP